MRVAAVVTVLVLTVAPALAVEVILNDGAVIVADSYEVVGGYVMIQLPGGGQLAYATEDVDLEATRAAEGGPEEPATEPARPREPASLAEAVSGMPSPSGQSTLRITDADVGHVDTRTGQPASGGESGGEEGAGPEPGSQVDGDVQAVRLNLREIRDGQYRLSGGVVNRYDFPVRNVYLEVALTSVGGEDLGQRRIDVADLLEPGVSESFEVMLESAVRPRWSVQVFWTQEQQPAAQGDQSPAQALPESAALGGA
jgi:hypothetical protein